jgi:hypothetical protein
MEVIMIPEIGKTYKIRCKLEDPEMKSFNYEGIGKCHKLYESTYNEDKDLWIFMLPEGGWCLFAEEDIIEVCTES